MIHADHDKHLIITVNNKVGTLAEITSIVSSSGINLTAVCAYAVDNVGSIMFVTENNAQAKKLLKSKGYRVREEGVILVTLDNKPGELQRVADKIAETGIDLTLVYGGVEKKADVSHVVLVTENNKAALVAIKLGVEDV